VERIGADPLADGEKVGNRQKSPRPAETESNAITYVGTGLEVHRARIPVHRFLRNGERTGSLRGRPVHSERPIQKLTEPGRFDRS
jgi:hypothetical protein